MRRTRLLRNNIASARAFQHIAVLSSRGATSAQTSQLSQSTARYARVRSRLADPSRSGHARYRGHRLTNRAMFRRLLRIHGDKIIVVS